MTVKTPETVLNFWFSERVRPLWFNSNPAFDQEIRDTFMDTYQAAAEGQLADWERTPEGALALVILLDQFPLNMFRGQPEGFATEARSREVAAAAIERGDDTRMNDEQKGFLYTPFMHSEHLADQDRSVALFQSAGLDNSLKWAEHHRTIVRRFGRFPHRNAILARDSTPQELEYLGGKGAFKG